MCSFPGYMEVAIECKLQ